MSLVDLARAISPEAEINVIGIRPGEKLHELLVSEDEARSTVELEDMFVVQPVDTPWETQWRGQEWAQKGKSLPDGFLYASNNNPEWMTIEQIQDMIAPIETALHEGKLE